MTLPFYKYEGLKNDFVIFDLRKLSDEDLMHAAVAPKLHRKLCERHSGIGADGILLLLPSDAPHLFGRMVITNSDGSRPEMCGNGIRCVAQYLFDQGEVTAGAAFTVGTDAGDKVMTILPNGGIRVGMGIARPLRNKRGEMLWGEAGDFSVVGHSLSSEPKWAVDMGNPHLVIRHATDFNLIEKDGPAWAAHPFFEAGVNVGFSNLVGPHRIELMVWERGAGATWACGTGACAAAVAWWAAEGWTQPVRVDLPGGPLEIEIRNQAQNEFDVFMIGMARHVYSGSLSLEDWSD